MKVIYNVYNNMPAVQEGDTYKFMYDVDTRAGHTHKEGSLLHVLESTTSAPYGEVGESGSNWVCKTEFGTSIWSTLEQCISRDMLKKV